ncbi:hypothetical protein DEM34_15580 [Spiribacter halobius]|uniref:Uncharacterized protein n=1 Tax=Sediminicurvatus halobius TaxID=2182432 RepID=A0A2U2MXZ9_9GAMM|nr:hypothetical protein DEM34_15580 [Spiribacter halobius]
MLWLFSRLRAADVPFDPTLYQVDLRPLRAAEQMNNMSESEFDQLRPALSREQLKRYAHRFSDGLELS